MWVKPKITWFNLSIKEHLKYVHMQNYARYKIIQIKNKPLFLNWHVPISFSSAFSYIQITLIPYVYDIFPFHSSGFTKLFYCLDFI